MIAIQPPPPTPAHSQAVSPLTNPNLSAALRLEYDALLKDMCRVQELCVEFQRQLVGKSHEADEFKELFAKTQSDLFQLQDSITELREERHRLANEAMRAAALSRKLLEVTRERDRLLAEIALSKQPAATPPARDGRSADPADVQAVVGEMWKSVGRLQMMFDSEVAIAVPSPQAVAAIKPKPEPANSSPS